VRKLGLTPRYGPVTNGDVELFLSDFLSHISPQYLDYMYNKYKQSTDGEMPPAWDAFFEGFKIGESEVVGRITQELKLNELIEEFRANGHKCANTRLFDEGGERCSLYEKLEAFENSAKYIAPIFAGFGSLTVEELKQYLKNNFTENVGIEFSHISDHDTRQWLEEKLNPSNFPQITPDKQKKWLNLLLKATQLEEFLQTHYPGKKRFSLEGAESFICALHELSELAVDSTIKEIELAMAHRGRVNVLANFLNWPMENVMAAFEEGKNEKHAQELGDVKYHLGFTNKINVNGKELTVSLAFNPSHLEFVYPVILGKVRAKIMNQFRNKAESILPVIVHGDAAFIGQGIVTETLNFSQLKPYSVGGSVHFIINNELGFTADSSETRSSIYCTNFAKALEAPIFHVNGNDVETLCRITKLAFEFRQKFNRDIFIEICCYRKHGHNEMDEPRYTNPKMYNKIQKLKPVSAIYKDKLLRAKIINTDESEQLEQTYNSFLEEKQKATRSSADKNSYILGDVAFQGRWTKYKPPSFEKMIELVETPITAKLLNQIVDAVHKNIPQEIHILPKLARALERRLEKYQQSTNIVWALGELISFGSLLAEGYSVRLVGQDSIRGTFSQRHIVYLDQVTGARYIPLDKFENNSNFEVYNSPLSENSTLAFEFGYSLSSPNCLTIWEAQFGDFINGAQVIVDQFIISSEQKWKRASGLVLLLPHGQEGQGPDHSSARIERFLQLAGQLNIQIAQPTTSAQYFHLLRRQMHQEFRKPLIIFTPKSMLRSELNASPADHFVSGGFLNVISSESSKNEKVGIVCTGKIYWELYAEAKALELLPNILWVRLEQLYPLDINKLKNIVEVNDHILDWQWVQEEGQNSGGWFFVKLSTMSLKWNLKYVGRPVSAVPAEGNAALHELNQHKIIEQALRKAR